MFHHQVLRIAITALHSGLHRCVAKVVHDVLLRAKAEQSIDYPGVVGQVQRSLSERIGRVDVYMRADKASGFVPAPVLDSVQESGAGERVIRLRRIDKLFFVTPYAGQK